MENKIELPPNAWLITFHFSRDNKTKCPRIHAWIGGIHKQNKQNLSDELHSWSHSENLSLLVEERIKFSEGRPQITSARFIITRFISNPAPASRCRRPHLSAVRFCLYPASKARAWPWGHTKHSLSPVAGRCLLASYGACLSGFPPHFILPSV